MFGITLTTYLKSHGWLDRRTWRSGHAAGRQEGKGENEELAATGVVPGVGAEHPQRAVLPAQPGAHARQALHLHLHGRLHGCAALILCIHSGVRV